MTAQPMINDRREILGWTMYDWANSAFSTTVVTTFLGPYLLSLAQNNAAADGLYYVASYGVEPAAIFPFCASLSVILQVLFLPILGTIADYTHLKKPMMMGFAYTGAAATLLLFFIQGNLVLLGGLLFIIANLAFGAAIVFYNAFLPDIASPDQRDTVSSRGFALGYLGGGLLLLLNLILVQIMPDNAGLAVRLSLASAGIWWLGFTVMFPQRRLKSRAPVRQLPDGENFLTHGVRQIARTARDMIRKYPSTAQYLLAYLIYNDGIQTVIIVSTSFAAAEIEGVNTTIQVLLVLMIQFVAFGGALAFGYLAKRIGAKRSIMISLVVWSGLVIFAYAFLYELWQLWVLGFFLALVLGGSQALSRSLFSQMIPANHEAEYFGFYEVSDRGTSWIGPLVFAAALQMTGEQRIAIVSLIIFFLVGLFLLSRVNVKRAIVDAGHDPAGVVL